MFEQIRRSYPFYAWIGLTDAQGTIVAGTDNLLVGKSVAQRDWFLRGREGLHFGDAHDAFLLAKMLPKPKWDDLPLRLVDVSAPVYDTDGQFLGVLCGHLSLDWAFEVREQMLDQLSQDSLDLIVLSREGKVLMGTPALPSLRVDLSKLTHVAALAQQTRSVGVDNWPDGKPYLTATLREAPFRSYPGMGWMVVARKPLALAQAPADDLARSILWGGLASALLFMMVLGWTLHRQLQPMEALADATRRLREQGLNVPLPAPTGHGELAELARSLAQLVGALQASNQELRLAERVFSESRQGIVITDASTRIVRVNTAFSRICGYPPEEALGQTPTLLKSGQQGGDFYAAMWQSIQRYGHWQGEVWNRAKDGRVYPEWLTINTLHDERGQITHYIGLFDDITEKKDYESRLLRLANYDALTDLPNRNLLQQQVQTLLAAAAQSNQPLALLFIDLDKFKHINDTLGHTAGDQVLREVARRFAELVNGAGLLARWGGDEFVLTLPGADGVRAAQVARQLADGLQRPFAIGGSHYHISMSCGIALYPTDGRTVEALLRCADTAMYGAKSDGANRYRFFESTMNAGVERFLRIDNALRHDLAQGGQHLSIAFQPQFSSDGARILGAEVLARWNHPELGNVSPAQFIPVAEDTGQISVLGDWIIDQAMQAYATLAQAGHTLPLSINVSAQQLHDLNLPERLIEACQRQHVPPTAIVVEVTESAVMSDEHKALQTLVALRAQGFRLSVDDFGTGYSCLNYIQRIHPSEIKIDQSFVARMLTDADSMHIVEFTQGLATSMGMDVVAEGVETAAQQQALQGLGPIHLQGFLLSRPVPLAALLALLQTHPSA